MLLAARGAAVVVNNRKREPAGEKGSADIVVDEIVAAGGKAVADYSSVETREAGERMVAAAIEKFGRLDTLFNNAGGNAPGVPFDELPFDKWQAVVDVNLTGMFLCAQAAFRMMKEQDPRGGRSDRDDD